MGIIKQTEGDQRLYNDTQATKAKIFRLLGHPGRTKIILMLVLNESLTLGEIKENLLLSQSATSELIKQLKETGLITGREVGPSVRYSLNRDMWESIKEVIQYFLDEVNNERR
jgi:ArsR family transcriptional regulator, arsenate/arsenite/antimonite-responsive transcriptional repressor